MKGTEVGGNLEELSVTESKHSYCLSSDIKRQLRANKDDGETFDVQENV